MSELIKHECGIALLQLKKPLSFYKDKYGSALYGINKMYLLMEKQHNRGQDGAGFASIKYNMSPGQRYISRVRSAKSQPIQHIFKTIKERIEKQLQITPELLSHPEKLKEEVQDNKHIIPEDSKMDWVRGGLPTRQMVRNADYLRRCQEKTFQ